MVDVLVWLLAVEVLGILAFPLAFLLFRALPDRGYSIVKPLGLVLGSYALWTVGLTRTIPSSQPAIFSIVGLLAIVGLFALWRNWDAVSDFARKEWRTLIAIECVFLAFFFLWAWVTSESPAITGTEKPMDFAFLNASVHATSLPPEDPWLSGHPISYYYFGHFMMGFLTQLTGIGTNVSYNLSISLVPAMAAAGAFGLTNNLVRLSGGTVRAGLATGLLASVLLLVIGNLEGVIEWVHSMGWGGGGFWAWVGIKGLEGGGSSAGGFPDQYLWWWRATRLIDTLVDGQSIDYTITEFPMFSFLLGDLHPHAMSLPFNLLVLSAMLHFFVSPGALGLAWLRGHPVQAVAISLLLGSLAFINAWDFPLMAGILTVLALVKTYGDREADLGRAVRDAAAVVVPIVALAVALFLPFYLSVDSQASGVLPVTGPGTRPFLFILAMGFLGFLGISFLLRQLVGLRTTLGKDIPLIKLLVLVCLAPFLLWADIVLVIGYIDDSFPQALAKVAWRTLWVGPALVAVGLAGLAAAQRVRLECAPATGFALIMLAAAFYLLAGVEFFYVVGLFGNRMNTVFKVYYQSWLLLSLVGGYGIYYWLSRHRATEPASPEPPSGQTSGLPTSSASQRFLPVGSHVWTVLVFLLLLASLYYPLGAVADRTGLFTEGHTLSDNTLDGLAFVRDSSRGEYEAIGWLREQAPRGRIVEAVGGDYSDFGRISASTGLPTVLGWRGHELQWRGSSDPMRGREADVAAVYQSGDPAVVLDILKRYSVRYVYLGSRERTRYGNDNLAVLGDLLETVWKGEGVTIYEFKPQTPQDTSGAYATSYG